MPIRLGCIVEGHGEVEAVPVVVRRIAERESPLSVVQILRPIRISKGRLVKAGELERAVELAARITGHPGGVLVVLDSDDDCPAEQGPALLARAVEARSDRPIGVVLAKREFEGWLLAAAESLRGQRGLPDNLQPPADPEAIRGAKEWLTGRMAAGRAYSPTLDQPALSARFDLDLARERSESFDKFYRDTVALISRLQSASR